MTCGFCKNKCNQCHWFLFYEKHKILVDRVEQQKTLDHLASKDMPQTNDGFCFILFLGRILDRDTYETILGC